MSDPVVFLIEDGVLALATVDKEAAGYLETWQAPDGKTADEAVVGDYDADGESWRCQVTTAALTAAANVDTTDIPATFCSPAKSTPNVGETSYSLEATILQDPNVKTGLSRFLFEHDTEEAFFLLGLDNGNPPKAIGRCRLVAGSFGGEARVALTADLTLPLSRKPDIAFGTADDFDVVAGGGAVTATGATAGTPGSFTPSGAAPPANLAAMSTVIANPATAWTTGQYVLLGDASHAHWSGTAWASGDAA